MATQFTEDDFDGMDFLHRAFAAEYIANGFDARKAAETLGLYPSQANILKRKPIIAAFIRSRVNESVTVAMVCKQQLDAMLDRMQDIAFGDVGVPMVLSDGTQIYGRQIHPRLIAEVFKARVNQLEEIDDPDDIVPTQIVYNVVDKRKDA
jgi:hypothetical protein